MGDNLSKNFFGRYGESLAEGFLKQKGYKIVDRNYRCKYGEIDLIAYDKKCLVFIEVKTRSSLAFSYPSEAITGLKKRKIIQTSLNYIKEKGLKDVNCRFDVISIVSSPQQLPGNELIDLIKGAFDSTSCGYYL